MRKTILLVEDDDDDETLAVRALTSPGQGETVVVVRDGAEALDYLFCAGAYVDRDPALPTVVLLDLHLPKVDGFEVLRSLRADDRMRSLPVVVLTSSSEDEDVTRSYHLGANSYIQKPVDFTQFTECLQHVGLYWLLLNEAPREAGKEVDLL